MKNWRGLIKCPDCGETAFVVGEEFSHCEMCDYNE